MGLSGVSGGGGLASDLIGRYRRLGPATAPPQAPSAEKSKAAGAEPGAVKPEDPLAPERLIDVYG